MSSTQAGGGETKLPTVLFWGLPSASIAVHRSPQRNVYYPDGMKLEIKLSPEIVLVETIRVVVPVVGGHPHAEHMFEFVETCTRSDYHKVRLQAFQQCLARVPGKKISPPHRAVIFGVSHQSIQDGIQHRFSIPGDQEQLIVKKKQVRWGDQIGDENDKEDKVYGGWGLEKVFEIPNRYQLRSMFLMTDVVDEGDDDDFELEDDLEILSPDEDEEDDQDEDEAAVSIDQPEQELIDESAESDDGDDDEGEHEEVAHNNVKRQRVSHAGVDDGEDDGVPASPPPVTLDDSQCVPATQRTSLEDEIKEFDMWLLQNDLVI
jgi:hypothetical protein